MNMMLGRARSEEELREMLHEAEERKVLWEEYFLTHHMNRRSNAEALRNFTALRGVIKTLRWALNMTDESGHRLVHPLD